MVCSHDQGFAELARETRDIARADGHWLKIVSAFSHEPDATPGQGIDRTDWFRMDRDSYEACLDPSNTARTGDKARFGIHG